MFRTTRLRTLKFAALAATLLSAGSLLIGDPAHAEKILNVGMAAADVGQLDPHRSATTQDKSVIAWMFNGLVRFKPGNLSPESIEPDLATGWDVSPDKLTWTFHLRPGVKFHGGYGDLTADDVVFSLKRAADPKSSAFSSDYASFDSFTASDPMTVVVKLKQPIPSVLGVLANYQGGNIVSKKAVEALGENFRIHPVGTGPFAFADYQPNQSVTMVANPDYFRGKPKIDKIVFRYILSDASRDLAFNSGEIDLIYGRQDQKWAERMKSQSDVVVDVFRPAELAEIYLNQTHKPLDDIRVRQAILLAINRPEVAKFKGDLVTVPAVGIVPSGYVGGEDLHLPATDIEKAKALLKEAGYPNGLTIKAIQTSFPTMLDSMQVVQAQLKKANIDLQLDVVDHPTFHAQIRKDLSDVVYYSAARFPIADVYLTQFFHSRSIVGTPTAVTNFAHCKVGDADIDAARIETDPVKQKALWADAQKKIMADICSVPVFEQLQLWAHRSKLDYGYKLDGSLSLGPLITEASTLN